MGETVKWIEKYGGPIQMEKLSIEKSSKLYTLIDASNNFYYNPVNGNSR